jgi:hypothetical protein
MLYVTTVGRETKRSIRIFLLGPADIDIDVYIYNGITLSGIFGIPGCPFKVGTDILLISHTISLSDGSKRNFDRRTANTTSEVHPC